MAGEKLAPADPALIKELEGLKEDNGILEEEVDHLTKLLRIAQDKNRKCGGSPDAAGESEDDRPQGPRPQLRRRAPRVLLVDDLEANRLALGYPYSPCAGETLV